MAFAGNDLVNFIGVPLAGFEAFKVYSANNETDLLMGNLLGEIKTPLYFLFGAGVVMVITLWFSRKARTVADTELKLSRQDEGSERFGSSAFSRYLVRRVVNTSTFFSKVIPSSVVEKISSRFDRTEFENSLKKESDPPMFDLVRAAVNMMVASILIAVGTSYKLPLSTTYVTFIVAMSTSLVDGAWGRDSAVYRITGVFTVILGWFFTGLAAFTMAFILSTFLGYTQTVGVIILVCFAVYAFYHSNKTHQKRESEKKESENEVENLISAEEMFEKCNNGIVKTLKEVNILYSSTIQLLLKEDHKGLRKQLQQSIELEKKLEKKRNNTYQILSTFPSPDSVEATHYYVLTLDYMKEIAHCVSYLIDPIYKHVDNNHKPLTDTQAKELNLLVVGVDHYINLVINVQGNNSNEKLQEIYRDQALIIELNTESRKNLIKSIKKNEIGTKNSMLVMTILGETRNILIYTSNLMKIQNDFTQSLKN